MRPSYHKKILRLPKKKSGDIAGREPPVKTARFSGIMSLQKTVGNQAVGQLLIASSPRMENGVRSPLLDSKPTGSDFSTVAPNSPISVSTPGDKHEREADRVEKQIMNFRQPEL